MRSQELIVVYATTSTAEHLAGLEAQERDLIAAGAAPRSQGDYRGHTPTAQRKATEVRHLKAEGLKPAEIADRLDISLRSYFRIVAGAASPTSR